MRSLDVEPLIIARYGDLLVVNKPHDWPTSGRSLADEDCIQFQLMRHFGGMVWAVHQLDADTSGLCLFTCSKALVIRVKRMMEVPGTRKEYLAIARGEPDWDEHEETSPIGMIDERSLGVSPAGRSARSVFEVIDRRDGYSAIRARIYTGRTHQIRIHLSHLGLPLVGEEWYASEPCKRHPRQALHAHRMVVGPSDLLPVDVLTAPIPDDLQQLADRLGLRLD